MIIVIFDYKTVIIEVVLGSYPNTHILAHVIINFKKFKSLEMLRSLLEK